MSQGSSPRVLASYRLTFGISLAAAVLNAVFGFVLAWVLVRYTFPGKRFVDALVDLPFALPTSVAGIVLAAIYAPNGWIGRWFEPLGFRIAFTPLGIFVALTFIGLPFVVRTLQPVLEAFEREQEEAAACLGATRWQTLRRVILPAVLPAEVAQQIKAADMGAAYLEATKLAGFSEAEAKRLFGRDPKLPAATERDYVTPWSAGRAEKQFLARFKVLFK